MSHVAALALTLASTSKTKSSSSSSLFFLVILVGFGAVWYFVLRPQQQRARKAREQGSQIEVGDEIVTIGGIVGTVLEMDGDRVTVLTGGGDGDGVPTRLVFVRRAIAGKAEPVVHSDDHEHDDAEHGLGDDHDHEEAEAHDAGDAGAADEDGPDGSGHGNKR